MPLAELISVLQQLYQARQQSIDVIYQITGIADIMRGQGQASETATAQNIKTQWGTLRVQRRQREVARYARDLLRMKAELIATKFSVTTLQQMSEAKYPTAEQKKAVMLKQQALQQQAMQQAVQQQQAQQPPGIQPNMGMQTPNMGMSQPPMPQLPPLSEDEQQTLKQPSWEDIQALMKDDTLRQFHIDVETDSTIAAIVIEDQKGITELLNGVVQYLQGVAPAVQSGALPVSAAKAMLLAAIRRFKLGSEVEDELDKIQAPKPEPAAHDNSAQQAAIQAKAQIATAQMKIQADQQAEQVRAQTEKEIAQMKAQMELISKKIDAMTEMRKAVTEAQLERERQQAEDLRTRDLAHAQNEMQAMMGAAQPTGV